MIYTSSSYITTYLLFTSLATKSDKEILLLERIQRRATKFILNDYKSDYKSRLNSTRLLPLMYWFELQDIYFLLRVSRTIQFCIISNQIWLIIEVKAPLFKDFTIKTLLFQSRFHLWNNLPKIDLQQRYQIANH